MYDQNQNSVPSRNGSEPVNPNSKLRTQLLVAGSLTVGALGGFVAGQNVEMVGQRPTFEPAQLSKDPNVTDPVKLDAPVAVSERNKGPNSGGPVTEAPTTSMVPEIGAPLAIANPGNPPETTSPNSGGPTVTPAP